MNVSTKVCSSFVAGLLLLGLPSVVTEWGGEAMAQAVEKQNTEADRLLNQGAEQLKAKNYSTALELLKQAYTLYKETDNSEGIIRSSLLFGYTFAGLGETERARGIFQTLLDAAIEAEYSWLEERAREGLQVLDRLTYNETLNREVRSISL